MARTAITKVTIEQQEMFLVVSGASTDLNYCPFCGQKFPEAKAEEARLCLQEATDQETSPGGPAPAGVRKTGCESR